MNLIHKSLEGRIRTKGKIRGLELGPIDKERVLTLQELTVNRAPKCSKLLDWGVPARASDGIPTMGEKLDGVKEHRRFCGPNPWLDLAGKEGEEG